MFVKQLKTVATVEDHYPFNLPIIKALVKRGENLSFNKPITFFSGENGSGKSTLLEAIAVAYGINPEGGSKNFNFSTFDSHSNFYQELTLVRNGLIPETTFFLRAENYYNFATEVEKLKMSAFYGEKNLHEMSHGEGMLSIINNRFTRNGFYILDEPESGLSVSRQLSLLEKIMTLSQQNCQFIIATHSPVLLAATNSTIFNSDDAEISQITYKETAAYQDMKLFLDDPERLLFYLMNE